MLLFSLSLLLVACHLVTSIKICPAFPVSDEPPDTSDIRMLGYTLRGNRTTLTDYLGATGYNSSDHVWDENLNRNITVLGDSRCDNANTEFPRLVNSYCVSGSSTFMGLFRGMSYANVTIAPWMIDYNGINNYQSVLQNIYDSSTSVVVAFIPDYSIMYKFYSLFYKYMFAYSRIYYVDLQLKNVTHFNDGNCIFISLGTCSIIDKFGTVRGSNNASDLTVTVTDIAGDFTIVFNGMLCTTGRAVCFTEKKQVLKRLQVVESLGIAREAYCINGSSLSGYICGSNRSVGLWRTCNTCRIDDRYFNGQVNKARKDACLSTSYCFYTDAPASRVGTNDPNFSSYRHYPLDSPDKIHRSPTMRAFWMDLDKDAVCTTSDGVPLARSEHITVPDHLDLMNSPTCKSAMTDSIGSKIIHQPPLVVLKSPPHPYDQYNISNHRVKRSGAGSFGFICEAMCLGQRIEDALHQGNVDKRNYDNIAKNLKENFDQLFAMEHKTSNAFIAVESFENEQVRVNKISAANLQDLSTYTYTGFTRLSQNDAKLSQQIQENRYQLAILTVHSDLVNDHKANQDYWYGQAKLKGWEVDENKCVIVPDTPELETVEPQHNMSTQPSLNPLSWETFNGSYITLPPYITRKPCTVGWCYSDTDYGASIGSGLGIFFLIAIVVGLYCCCKKYIPEYRASKLKQLNAANAIKEVSMV